MKKSISVLLLSISLQAANIPVDKISLGYVYLEGAASTQNAYSVKNNDNVKYFLDIITPPTSINNFFQSKCKTRNWPQTDICTPANNKVFFFPTKTFGQKLLNVDVTNLGGIESATKVSTIASKDKSGALTLGPLFNKNKQLTLSPEKIKTTLPEIKITYNPGVSSLGQMTINASIGGINSQLYLHLDNLLGYLQDYAFADNFRLSRINNLIIFLRLAPSGGLSFIPQDMEWNQLDYPPFIVDCIQIDGFFQKLTNAGWEGGTGGGVGDFVTFTNNQWTSFTGKSAGYAGKKLWQINWLTPIVS